jgi:hypothetical protein
LSFYIRYRFLRHPLEAMVGKKLNQSSIFKLLFRDLNAN